MVCRGENLLSRNALQATYSLSILKTSSRLGTSLRTSGFRGACGSEYKQNSHGGRATIHQLKRVLTKDYIGKSKDKLSNTKTRVPVSREAKAQQSQFRLKLTLRHAIGAMQ